MVRLQYFEETLYRRYIYFMQADLFTFFFLTIIES